MDTKAMSVEEAIEFLEKAKIHEGEKYKAMWEELKDKYGFWIFGIVASSNLKEIMKNIEQKYFPKLKRTITIEVEAKDNKILNGFEKFLKEIDKQYGEHGDIKVNIKEDLNAN